MTRCRDTPWASGFVRRNLILLAWCVARRPWLLAGGGFRNKLRAAARIITGATAQKKSPFARRPGRSFGVLAIAVDPGAQGRGIGKFLMDKLESSARESGFSRMNLTVAVDNARGLAFYERLGWKKVASGGDWQGRMEKVLQEDSQPTHQSKLASHSSEPIEPSLPAVTIVVPCRNEFSEIEGCLRSILAQEEPARGFEIVVADGMSDDGTRQLLS